MIKKTELKHLIDVAAGRVPADVVIRNAQIVDVFLGTIRRGDVALAAGYIAGIGERYEGQQVVDLAGRFLLPGLIDAHIHVESSYVSPEEFSRIFVPCGTTTALCDPHEIVNVAGLKGLEYMEQAAKLAKMDIRYLMPSCVPSTPFEHAGANLSALDMEPALKNGTVDGLAELMNYVGVVNNDDKMIDEVMLAKKYHRRIDGHAPQVFGKLLNAYAAAGVVNDHECSTVQEAKDRLACGMYVLLRQGTTEHDLKNLLPVVNPQTARHCLLAGDDVQAVTAMTLGHLDNSIRICIEQGLSPITAIQMATLNAAEYCGLNDRGAIAPGRRADLVVVDDLRSFHVEQTWIKGEKVAQAGQYLPKVQRYPIDAVAASMHVKPLASDCFKLHLTGKAVRTIKVIPGEVLTDEAIRQVSHDETGDFVYDQSQDVVKLAVIERHHATGKMCTALVSGYGIKHGTIAISIGHDSHNIMTAGVSDSEMLAAVAELIKQGGGVVMVKDQKPIARMALPIAGLMSDQPAEQVVAAQNQINQTAHQELGIPENIDPVMSLSFLPLAVIPKLKLTDEGLFDVANGRFVTLEVDDQA